MLWLLITCTALLESTASAQIHSGLPGNIDLSEEGGSEAYSHKNFKTTLCSTYNFLKCTSDLNATPNSTQDVSDLIKLYTSRNKPVKIRATRAGFHSSSGFVCPGKRDSSKEAFKRTELAPSPQHHPDSISKLLHLMNRVVSVDPEHHQLTIEAGMTVLDLANAAEANNMSIRAGAFPVYSNLTVGGIITTSAHGSGLVTVISSGGLVTKIKWMNAKGEIVVSDSKTEAGAKEVNALVGRLGLLAITTEFTFQLEPNSWTVTEGREKVNDTNIMVD